MPCQLAGESSICCRRRGNRPKSLRQKNRETDKTLWKVGAHPRAEGVSATDRVPGRESLRLQTEGHDQRPFTRSRATLEARWRIRAS